MANTFEFVGKIVPCKETENFKPYEKRAFNSGWSKTTLKFNVVCGANRHMVEVGAFTPPNITEATIYTSVKEGDEYVNKQITYNERLDPEIVESVPSFRRFTVDTEFPNRRYRLKDIIEKEVLTDEQMSKLGVSSVEEAQVAYKKSCAKKHDFIWEYDFAEYLHNFIKNEKIKDMMWRITGTYDLEYNENGDQWYRKFKVQKIYRCNDDEAPKSQGSFVVTFGDNAVDDTDFAETGKLHINGFITQYLGKPYRKNCYAPMTFTVNGSKDEAAHKRAEGFKRMFTFPAGCEAEYRELGVICDILDGAEVVELTEDMLTDEQREYLEYGLITMDDIKKELDRPVYGDRVTDIVIVKPARGFSNGAVDTALTVEDVGRPKSDLDEPEPKIKKTTVTDDEDDDEFDIFADDEI